MASFHNPRSVSIYIRPWAGWLRNWNSTPRTGKRFFLPPQHPDWLWVPSLLFNEVLCLLHNVQTEKRFLEFEAGIILAESS
jgi:hypothetical protein